VYLTEKQRRFAEEYLSDHDGARAYSAVYPTVTGAKAAAGAERLLARAELRRYLRAREQPDEANAPPAGAPGQADVLRGLTEIAFPAEAGLVADRDRLRALELLGKLLGLFDRREETGPVTVRFEGTEGAEE